MDSHAEHWNPPAHRQADRVPWQRYCVPRGEPWLSEQGGFLFDPESEYAKYYGTKPVALSDLRTTPVVILLGEAGIGKSDTLRREFEQAKQSHTAASTLFVDLRKYGQGDNDRLLNEIFESEPFSACTRGERVLYPFLDSFDECGMDIKHLPLLFASAFEERRHLTAHMFLRIASRGAMWPSELEETLRQLWPENQVGVFELCPLRKQDVALRAQSMNLDTEAFLAEVAQREVETLASRPKTLTYLLGEFSRHGQLPQRKTELFERASLQLCEEDTRRKEVGRSGKLSPGQRLRIASRIAAAIVFGNRTGLWMGASLDKDNSDLVPDEVTGEERDGECVFQVSSDEIHETRNISGLFSQLAPNRAHFQHQSDAEFLAALYVH